MLREQAAGLTTGKVRNPVENVGSLAGIEDGVVNIADQR
jgi:hypothetical protein